ncbi:MAG TPA: 23S rRNA (adenine(2030)-N(6))-methyltransferase RlmJ [Dokdonella sp.]|uniref:23S rRNA (adenine(2030)-N(6))-methyltransferase RlmJ n=1 Tax=Dokdonella sp. TaxID=2291710 RepID=UPI002C4108AB|nr:23S rRNA (adenine(2030)-N(6))-methyltransferase RlmJ [Dokdonella sp.]HOX70103.1 23S rRNA (adenine(2030)-N(6))-methyltransferase RlmJ [Dokdonella sp.]HPG94423.1 23S rRNA (adenine(2030)-N(6))-methyltransferase RlmJ [Dokdonella sp.]HPN79245.1 23S rRNA (adenine(2030)-N(6))-methyltransferase RlmJ [Dokdonella sp.]
MNYRHAFHAGNFADVFKHTILIGLLEALKSKQKPFSYMDTHAGRGRYLLDDAEATRTAEAADGVQRLLTATRLPTLVHVYVNLVRSLNAGRDEIVEYPGSPLIASLLMREEDRGVLCELHAEDCMALKAALRGDARFAIHERDGYGAMNALLPPKVRRGLVLIDPPFEAQDGEFRVIEKALADAAKRWASGTYAVWYPIKLRQQVQPFHRWLTSSGFGKVLVTELLLHPDNSALRLNGCGMAIINPPWKFERQLEELLPSLQTLLGQGRYGQHRLEWLVHG